MCRGVSPVWPPFPSTLLDWTVPRVPAQGHVLAHLSGFRGGVQPHHSLL